MTLAGASLASAKPSTMSAMTPQAPPADLRADPMPMPPQLPELEACCGDGCNPCIFDLHDLAMDAYRQALRAWRARHPDLPTP